MTVVNKSMLQIKNGREKIGVGFVGNTIFFVASVATLIIFFNLNFNLRS
ncbi:MAG: hypothetical protein ABS911_03670 [Carnobacterium sp.]